MKAKRECKDMSSLLFVGPRGKAMHISDELICCNVIEVLIFNLYSNI
jgi:hypothetical protein